MCSYVHPIYGVSENDVFSDEDLHMPVELQQCSECTNTESLLVCGIRSPTVVLSDGDSTSGDDFDRVIEPELFVLTGTVDKCNSPEDTYTSHPVDLFSCLMPPPYIGTIKEMFYIIFMINLDVIGICSSHFVCVCVCLNLEKTDGVRFVCCPLSGDCMYVSSCRYE